MGIPQSTNISSFINPSNKSKDYIFHPPTYQLIIIILLIIISSPSPRVIPKKADNLKSTLFLPVYHPRHLFPFNSCRMTSTTDEKTQVHHVL